MPRLTVLRAVCPAADGAAAPEITGGIQGFGAVGAHAARILHERLPSARVIGISDREGYLFDTSGLRVEELFAFLGRSTAR